MNPLKTYALYRRASRLLSLFQRAAQSAEGVPMSKSLFASKTFWVNVISASLELAQALGGVQLIPAGSLTLITNILNIALRAVTEQPVHLVKPKE